MCRRNFHLWTFSNHEAFLEIIRITDEEQYAKTSGPEGMVLVIIEYNNKEFEAIREQATYDELLERAQKGELDINEMPFHNWDSFRAVVEFIKKRNITDIFGVVQIEV